MSRIMNGFPTTPRVAGKKISTGTFNIPTGVTPTCARMGRSTTAVTISPEEAV